MSYIYGQVQSANERGDEASLKFAWLAEKIMEEVP